jgi:hypothetical protein
MVTNVNYKSSTLLAYMLNYITKHRYRSKLMSFMSFGALTCFVRHLFFCWIKVSQMMNWSAPLRRARQDDRNRYIICYIWSPESRDINSAPKPSWEESRRHEKVCHRRWGPPIIGAGRPAPPQVNRPMGPPISHHLRTSVLHRLRVCIWSRFDPRALVHPTNLYKQPCTSWGRGIPETLIHISHLEIRVH